MNEVKLENHDEALKNPSLTESLEKESHEKRENSDNVLVELGEGLEKWDGFLGNDAFNEDGGGFNAGNEAMSENVKRKNSALHEELERYEEELRNSRRGALNRTTQQLENSMKLLEDNFRTTHQVTTNSPLTAINQPVNRNPTTILLSSSLSTSAIPIPPSSTKTVHTNCSILPPLSRSSESSDTDNSGSSQYLLQQNSQLRRVIIREQHDYERKVKAFHQGQQRQTILVQKLQEKLLQYKQKCTDLEERLNSTNYQINTTQHDSISQEHSRETERLLVRIDEEVQRANNLTQINDLLRDQLDQSQASNLTLSSELHRVSRHLEKMERREQEFKKKEQSRLQQQADHRSKILALSRMVTSLKSDHETIKVNLSKSQLRLSNELSKTFFSIQNSCQSYAAKSNRLERDLDLERRENERLLEMLAKRGNGVEEEKKKSERRMSETHDTLRKHSTTIESLKAQLTDKESTVDIMKLKLNSLHKKVKYLEKSEILKNENKKKTRRNKMCLDSSEDEQQCGGGEEKEEMRDNDDSDGKYDCGDDNPFNDDAEEYTSLKTDEDNYTYKKNIGNGIDRKLTKNENNFKIRKVSRHHSYDRKIDCCDNDGAVRVMGGGEMVKNRSRSSSPVRNHILNNNKSKNKQKYKNKNYSNKIHDVNINGEDGEGDKEDTNDDEDDKEDKNDDEDDNVLTTSSILAVFRKRLHTKQLELMDLKSELLNSGERIFWLEERVEGLVGERKELKARIEDSLVKIKQLTEKHDEVRRDNEMLEGRVEGLEVKKKMAETSKENLTNQNGELEKEVKKVRSENQRIAEEARSFEEKTISLAVEKDKLNKMLTDCKQSLMTSDHSRSSGSCELLKVKDMLDRAMQEVKLVGMEKEDMGDNLKQTQRERQAIETEVASLQSMLSQSEENVDRLNKDKHALNSAFKKLEAERQGMVSEKGLLEESKEGVLDKLNKSEEQKEEIKNNVACLETELAEACVAKESLSSKLKKVELDVIKVSEQLKESMQGNEELLKQQEIIKEEGEKLKVSVADMTVERDALVREVEEKELRTKEMKELVVTIEGQANDKEAEVTDLTEELKEREGKWNELNQQLHETKKMIAGMKDDVERLTEELKKSTEDCGREKEEKDSLIAEKKEEMKKVIEKGKSDVDGLVEAANEEKTRLIEKCDNRENELLTKMDEEKKGVEERMKVVEEGWKEEVFKVRKSMQVHLLSAEKERQELLDRHEDDRSDLVEKLTTLKRDLATQQASERRHRGEMEGMLRGEKGRGDALEGEVDRYRKQTEQDRVSMTEEMEVLRNRLKEVAIEKDDVSIDNHDFKTQLKSASDRINKLKSELREFQEKLFQEQGEKERMEKELMVIRRGLSEGCCEMEVLRGTLKDVREALKSTEKEKVLLNRCVLELERKMQALESTKAMAGKETGELRIRVGELEGQWKEWRRVVHATSKRLKVVEVDKEKLLQDLLERETVVERKGRMVHEMKGEMDDLKKKLSEALKMKENYMREVEVMGKTIEDLKVEVTLNEAEFKGLVMEKSRKEMEWGEEKMRVEGFLQELESELKLVGEENARLEKEVEVLRREKIMMIGLLESLVEGVGKKLQVARSRSDSPVNKVHSSPKDVSSLEDLTFQVSSTSQLIKEFSEWAFDVEQERRNIHSKLESCQQHSTSQLVEAERTKFQLQSSKSAFEISEKKRIELEGMLVECREMLREGEERERKREKEMVEGVVEGRVLIKRLEQNNEDLQKEATELKKKIVNELEVKVQRLQQQLCSSEKQLISSEEQRKWLEGEVCRFKMTANDKETEKRVLSSRTEGLFQQLEALETKSSSMQTTIQQLHAALARCQEEKLACKQQLISLHHSLNDKSCIQTQLEEKTKMSRKFMTSLEDEKTALHDQLEHCRNAISEVQSRLRSERKEHEESRKEAGELKGLKEQLEGQVKSLLDTQNRHSDEDKFLNDRLENLLVEKKNLQEMVASLQRSLQESEDDGRGVGKVARVLKRDKTLLKKSLYKSEEALTQTCTEQQRMDGRLMRLQDENDDLVVKITKLQKVLCAVEQEHDRRLIEMTSQQEERLHRSQGEWERVGEVRGVVHQREVHALRDQISYLKDKLDREVRQKQLLVSKDNCKLSNHDSSHSNSNHGNNNYSSHNRRTATGTHVTKHHSSVRSRVVRGK